MKQKIKLISIILILLAIPVTIIAVKQINEIRSKASVTTTSFPTEPIVGAIRWDIWSPTITMHYRNFVSMLDKDEWHYRWPFFAYKNSSNQLEINEDNQEVIDQQILYSSQAGINYWVFDWYNYWWQNDSSPNYKWHHAIDHYLQSIHKDKLDYSLMLMCCTAMFEKPSTDLTTPIPPTTWRTKAVPKIVEHVKNPTYQKVLNGRPIIYFYSAAYLPRFFNCGPKDPESTPCPNTDPTNARNELQYLRDKVMEAGLPNPYLVALVHGEWGYKQTSFTSPTGLGMDAISTYSADGRNKTPIEKPYSDLVASNSAMREIAKSVGNKIIPTINTGWDRRPDPNFTEKLWNKAGTPEEIAANLKLAVDWNKANPTLAETNNILIYALNEYVEGGWLGPTIEDKGARLNAIADVLGGTHVTPIPTPTPAPTPKLDPGKIRSVTFYNFPDSLALKPSQFLQDFNSDLPKIKDNGFNAVWFIINMDTFFDANSIPKKESFDKLKTILQTLKDNNMKAILPLNYGGGNAYKEQMCNILIDHDAYLKYAKRHEDFMRQIEGYSDSVFILVFTESEWGCLGTSPGGDKPLYTTPEGGEIISKLLKTSLGRLPKDIDPQVRSKFTMGYHDAFTPFGWNQGTPSMEADSYDFFSIPHYEGPIRSDDEIISSIEKKITNTKSFFPNITIFFGEVGASYCLSPWDEDKQSHALQTIASHFLEKGIGFNEWGWRPIYFREADSTQRDCAGANGGRAIRNPDGSPKKAAITLKQLFSPTPTPRPSSTPTPIPTRVPTPTPTRRPTSTLTPTLSITTTPTPTFSPGSTIVNLTVGIDGIGVTSRIPLGGNKNPKNKTRTLEIKIYKASDNLLVFSGSQVFSFNSSTNRFDTNITLPSSFGTGIYNLYVLGNPFLTARYPGSVTITKGQEISLNSDSFNLITGDVNKTDQSKNLLNILDYNIVLSCSVFSKDTVRSVCNQNSEYLQNSDLDDDGIVNQNDITLFIKEMGNQSGDILPGD